jgi:broad specificity phosphatase PhoE
MAGHERRLWLIRHGETEWSKSGQHTGRTDIPLTDEGRRQAERLRPLLREQRFAAVLVSPRARARVTCELAGLSAHAKVDDGLAEWDYGAYEGLTSQEIHAEVPSWSLWIDGGPGGESPEQIGARADALLTRVDAVAGDDDVALFAHGHILRVIALRYLGWPFELGAQLGLDTATVSKLGIVSGHRSVVGWNLR